MEGAIRTCVIVDGGLQSLVNCFMARERILAVGGDIASNQPIAYMPTFDGLFAALKTQAAEKQAAVCGLKLVRSGVRIDSNTGESGLVIAAAYLAAREGCDVLDWPIQRASVDSVDIDAAALDADRCLLITRLVSMDTLRPQFRVDCPLVDLTDRQLCDLAVDMDLPLATCWWWKELFVNRILERKETEVPAAISGDPVAAGMFKECARWVPTLKEVRFLAEAG